MENNVSARRGFVKSTVFGLLAASTSTISYGLSSYGRHYTTNQIPERYPALELEQVSGVVGASHGNFEKVKDLVGNRPELACATWDWGFGDFESAIGAASHMGRRDIAEYLIENGARPNIFTLVIIGALDGVKSMVASIPGIQRTPGPHGITLLQHAKNRLWHKKDMTAADIEKVTAVKNYLVSLGDADLKPDHIKLSEEEKKAYLGEYKFGEGKEDAFIVELNMRKLLSIARKGDFGKGMLMTAENEFILEAAPSVKITFENKNGQASSLTIKEPSFSLMAKRV